VPDEFSIPERRQLVRLFPALRLVGAIRQAFDLRKLLTAALGLAILQAGWTLLDQLVPAAADTTPALLSPSLASKGPSEPGFWSSETLVGLHNRLSEPFRLLATPLFALLEPGAGWLRMLHATLSVIWLIVVWGICGGAISRIAIVQAAAQRQTSITTALRFALDKSGPLIMAPLCPLFGVTFLALICAGFGLLYRVPWIGTTLAGIGLVFPLAAGLVMTLLIAGLVAGWPLLHAATASGADDSLDAMSRIFGYLNQRLGAYLALVALAWLMGMLGLTLIDALTAGVIHLTHWSLSLTAPIAVTETFFGTPATASSPTIASALHAFWLGVVRLIAHGWVFSFFWTAAAYLYLWLRLEIDGVSWYEIEPPRSEGLPGASAGAPHVPSPSP
jgi:hypothetical protein